MVLDGQIDHPTRDLHFDAPNATLGLKDVTGHLDPTAQGFDYTAKGQSRLGPLTSHGAILLPAGGQRSEEHTSELQSLMRISYAVLCMKKTKRSPATTKSKQTNDPLHTRVYYN